MNLIFWIFSLGLLANIGAGLWLVTARRGREDALLSALLFGTAGVALTLLLGHALGQERAIDVALVFALLSAVLGVAFSTWTAPERERRLVDEEGKEGVHESR